MDTIRTLLRLKVLLLLQFVCSASDGIKVTSGGSVHPEEVEALIAFRDAITSDPKDALSTWTGRTVCEWEGVRCYPPEGHRQTVVQLDLGDKDLEGTLTPQITDLTSLHAIYLQGNKLTGELPDFSVWQGLKGLYLGNGNKLSGALPKRVAHLKSLQALNLKGLGIEGTIPRDFESLVALKELDMAENPKLVGKIPKGLFSRPKEMTWLRLNECSFTGTIPPMTKLKDLKVLRLGTNRLTGTLPSFSSRAKGALEKVLEMDFSNNLLTGTLPESLGDMKKMKVFDANNNQFTGTIPRTLGLWTQADWIQLGKNKLTGTIPTHIGKWNNVQAVFLDHNQLTGTLPEAVESMRKLQQLQIDRNPGLCGPSRKLRNTSFFNTEGTSLGKPCEGVAHLGEDGEPLEWSDPEPTETVEIHLGGKTEL